MPSFFDASANSFTKFPTLKSDVRFEMNSSILSHLSSISQCTVYSMGKDLSIINVRFFKKHAR